MAKIRLKYFISDLVIIKTLKLGTQSRINPFSIVGVTVAAIVLVAVKLIGKFVYLGV